MKREQTEAWALIGAPKEGGVLIISDHASNHIPADLKLGVSAADQNKHIAIDIGVADVAALLVAAGAVDAAIFGGVSRLVIDCNREEDSAGLIPHVSDGVEIAGNQLDAAGREARLARFHRPYHDKIAALIDAYRPKFIISLHSFTPKLESQEEVDRPWHVGVLYNEDERLAAAAIAALEATGAHVGDQLPYSGRLLNATMNRHAEANAIAYIGIELRQDLVGDALGHADWADRLRQMITACHHALDSAKSMIEVGRISV